jgi:hypothetical protein
LTLGFFVQSTGATVFLKKSVVQAEQLSDETQKGEEKVKDEAKTDHENTIINIFVDCFFKASFSTFIQHTRLYPPGFYSTPFLPPR